MRVATSTETPRKSSASPRLPDYSLETEAYRSGYKRIAGIDEVGRGPLAGPVVAVAAVIPLGLSHPWLRDSKKLSPTRRQEVCTFLQAHPEVEWAVGEASVEDIDHYNILQASLLAMRRALSKLAPAPDFVLVDGNKLPESGYTEKSVVGGDGISCSIAAASILAKEFRDSWMKDQDLQYPDYGFSKHKGYGTQEHLEAIRRVGLCPLHRKSFFRKRLASLAPGA